MMWVWKRQTPPESARKCDSAGRLEPPKSSRAKIDGPKLLNTKKPAHTGGSTSRNAGGYLVNALSWGAKNFDVDPRASHGRSLFWQAAPRLEAILSSAREFGGRDRSREA